MGCFTNQQTHILKTVGVSILLAGRHEPLPQQIPVAIGLPNHPLDDLHRPAPLRGRR
jgi:hypothetical protein